MCEASAFIVKDGDEKLILEAVDVIEPEEGGYKLVSIFGEQKFVNAKIKSINLISHRVLFEEN
jgi:predicted RNA-binding protein